MYLGFNNRTCSKPLQTKKGSGPVLRGPSASMMWREWVVRRVMDDFEEDRSNITSIRVTIQAFVPQKKAEYAKCLGFISALGRNVMPGHKDPCVIPPYASVLFLNESQSNMASAEWNLVQGANGFELWAANRLDICRRKVGVEGCNLSPILLEREPLLWEGPTLYTWQLMRRYDLVYSAPVPTPALPTLPTPALPPLPLAPGPSPSPKTGIPGPSISAPSFTNNGYVNVIVNTIGGNGQCSVTTVIIVYECTSVEGAIPETREVSVTPSIGYSDVLIPLILEGYYKITAVGKCASTGQITDASNQISVYSNHPPPDVVAFSVKYGGIDYTTFSVNDQNQVCRNMLTLQPGGACKIFQVFPGSAVVVGNVVYSAEAYPGAAASLTQSLNSYTPGSPVYITLLDNIPATGVVTEFAGPVVGPTTAGVPPPPEQVTVTPSSANCPDATLDVTFQAPQTTIAILYYVVSCMASEAATGLNSTVITASGQGTFASVRGVSPNTQYVCQVQSAGYAGLSKIVASSSVRTMCTAFSGPWYLALSGNLVYVANVDTSSVSMCSIIGSSVTGCQNIDGFSTPTGIGVNNNQLFVSNSYNGTVSVCSINGYTVNACQATGGFTYPMGINFSGGKVYVSDNSTVKACDVSGNTLQGCQSSPGFMSAAGIEISGSTTYVGTFDGYSSGAQMCTISSGLLSNCITTPGLGLISYRAAVSDGKYFVTGLGPAVTVCDLDANGFPSQCQENLLEDLHLYTNEALFLTSTYSGIDIDSVASKAYLLSPSRDPPFILGCPISGRTLGPCSNATLPLNQAPGSFFFIPSVDLAIDSSSACEANNAMIAGEYLGPVTVGCALAPSGTLTCVNSTLKYFATSVMVDRDASTVYLASPNSTRTVMQSCSLADKTITQGSCTNSSLVDAPQTFDFDIVQGSSSYLARYNALSACDFSSGTFSNCVSKSSTDILALSIAIDAVHSKSFSTGFPGIIQTCNVNQKELSGCESLFPMLNPIDMAIHSGYMFATGSIFGGTVLSCPMDPGPLLGACRQTTQADFGDPKGIQISGSKAFVANNRNSTIIVCDISGYNFVNCQSSV